MKQVNMSFQIFSSLVPTRRGGDMLHKCSTMRSATPKLHSERELLSRVSNLKNSHRL